MCGFHWRSFIPNLKRVVSFFGVALMVTKLRGKNCLEHSTNSRYCRFLSFAFCKSFLLNYSTYRPSLWGAFLFGRHFNHMGMPQEDRGTQKTKTKRKKHER